MAPCSFLPGRRERRPACTVQLEGRLEAHLPHHVSEQCQARVNLFCTRDRLAAAQRSARSVLERGHVQRRFDAPWMVRQNLDGQLESVTLTASRPECANQRQGDGRFVALGADSSKGFGGKVFAPTTQERDRLG